MESLLLPMRPHTACAPYTDLAARPPYVLFKILVFLHFFLLSILHKFCIQISWRCPILSYNLLIFNVCNLLTWMHSLIV